MSQDLARQYAIRLLSQRPYSKSRLLFKLKQKGYEAEAAPVLAELEEKGAINDARFAQAFTEQSQLQRPSGKQRVILALRRRGIDQATATAAWQKWEAVTAQLSPLGSLSADGLAVGMGLTPTAAAAIAAATTRLARGDLDLQRWEDKQKLLAFLNRRGFVYTEAKAALARLITNQAADHEGVEGAISASHGPD